MDITINIYSSDDGYLDSFHILTVVSSKVINMGWTCVCIVGNRVLWIYMLRREMVGLYDRFSSSLLRNLFFTVVVPVFFPMKSTWSFTVLYIFTSISCLLFFLMIYLFIFNVYWYFACMYICLYEDVRSPGTGVTDSCKLFCGCWE